MTHPWARQASDADAPWAAFQNWLYACPRPRRIADLAKIHPDIDRSLLEFWAEHGAWRDRADAWDDHLDRLRTETFENEVVSMAKRQAALAQSLQELATEDVGRMRKTQRRLREAPLLAPRDVLRYASVGMSEERRAAGIPEGAVTAVPWDLERLTPEERAQLRALVERVTPK